MRKSIIAIITALWLITLFTSCAAPAESDQITPQPVSAATGIPTPTVPTSTQIPHAPEIRFALVGEPTDVNVWALFDEQGASYANYALRNDYWPRLFYLAPPEFIFTSRAAGGEPSPVTQEGDFFTSTVSLRPDLKWTDGSPYTAEDMAFTVNAVLHFELGFDWKAYYPPDYLARAEAVDSSTVRFYFKKRPNVGVWQYGALQGPVVQRKFWEPKVEAVAGLLPDASLPGTIDNALSRIKEYQPIVNSLSERVYILQAEGKQDRQLEMELKRKQGNLDEANNDLTKALAEYADKLQAAHQALYALDDQGEPTLGVWMPAGKENDKWVNEANPDFPFEKPNFDRAVYQTYPTERDALEALQDGNVDFILSPGGVSEESTLAFPSVTLARNETGSARFLVFNPIRAELADPALRHALACKVDNFYLSNTVLEKKAEPLWGVVLRGSWQYREAIFGCSSIDATLRLPIAFDMLRQAGYTWTQEPSTTQAGQGLLLPGGAAFPHVTLLAPDESVDPSRARAAAYLEEEAQYLGIPLTKQLVDAESVRYAVFSSSKYDMAIVGWRLSAYPGYLCEWFGAQGQFSYNETRIRSECEALAEESNLDVAREHILRIQSILAEGSPFIPLYTELTYDAYRNIRYPFDSALGGLNGLYGAPSLAIPLQ